MNIDYMCIYVYELCSALSGTLYVLSAQSKLIFCLMASHQGRDSYCGLQIDTSVYTSKAITDSLYVYI